jgi:hypothetical protein
LDKHEFAEIICEGLKQRKIEKKKKKDDVFLGYVTDRAKKVEKVHNRFRK